MIPVGILSQGTGLDITYVTFNGDLTESENPSVPVSAWKNQVQVMFELNAIYYQIQNIVFNTIVSLKDHDITITRIDQGVTPSQIAPAEVPPIASRQGRGILGTGNNAYTTFQITGFLPSKTYRIHFLSKNSLMPVLIKGNIYGAGDAIIQTLNKPEAQDTGTFILDPYETGASAQWLTTADIPYSSTNSGLLQIEIRPTGSSENFFINAMAIECL